MLEVLQAKKIFLYFFLGHDWHPNRVGFKRLELHWRRLFSCSSFATKTTCFFWLTSFSTAWLVYISIERHLLLQCMTAGMPRLCPQRQSLAGEFIKMPFDIFFFMIFANLTETFPPFWKLNPELSTETSKRSINCLGSVIVARTKTGDTKTRRLHIAPWEKTLDYSQNFTKTKSPMQRNGRTASNSDTTFVCAESSNPARGFPFVPVSEWRTWPQGGWKGWGWFLRQFQDVGPGQCPILLCWTSLAVGTSSQATSKSIPAQWIWNAYTAWPGSPKI